MTLYVLFLVLTAAVLHASWNMLAKKAKGKTPLIWLQYLAGSILYLPIFCFPGYHWRDLLAWPVLLFGFSSAVLHFGYFSLLQKGYRNADLSVVYPMARGSALIISFIAAIVFLQEKFRFSAAVGLLLIVGGVLVITGLRFRPRKTDAGGKPDNAIQARIIAGVTYGVLTGLFIALYTFNDTIAVKNYAVSPVLLTLVTGLFSTVFLAPFMISQKHEVQREIKMHKWIILAIAVLSPLAYILVLEALKYAPLSVVAPARETSILLGVFMGSSVFNEDDGKRRIIASALILGGIVALSVG